MERASGVLMHISTLYGDYSIGSFGKNAKEFVDFLCECGFKYWQTLPFNMSDEVGSPYKSYGAFSGNPYFVDIDLLASKGLLTADEVLSARQSTPYSCEFEKLSSERLALLKKAAARVCREEREKIERVIGSKKAVLDFCRFMALKEANEYAEWSEWTTENYNADDLFAWEFIQYEFLSEWSEIRSYANSKGIKIIGDIPIYVAYDSSDVWANKSEFQLDAKGRLKAVAGVPPDYFAKDGQLWGNPLYDWNAMKKNGYSWWSERIKYMLELFDGVRIDHFRAAESYWSVDAKAENARFGEWEKGPGMDFVNMIKQGMEVETTQITDSGTETKRTLKVVGVYSVKEETNYVIGTTYRFMANKNLIQDCNGYTGQGDYSKIIFPSKGTLFGPNVIANYMSSKDGFALVWYGNSALSIIKSNESTIKQAADLFLYIALVLALFSMFMLQ